MAVCQWMGQHVCASLRASTEKGSSTVWRALQSPSQSRLSILLKIVLPAKTLTQAWCISFPSSPGAIHIPRDVFFGETKIYFTKIHCKFYYSHFTWQINKIDKYFNYQRFSLLFQQTKIKNNWMRSLVQSKFSLYK